MFSQIIISGFRKTTAGIDIPEIKLGLAACVSAEITGISLFTEGVFLSVVEGSTPRTTAMFKFIKRDTRLSEVGIIMENSINTREFDDFRIGFSHTDLSDTIPNVFKLDSRSYKNSLPKHLSSELCILTDTFVMVNALQ